MPTAKVVLENVFGMLGIVFWSFQLLPQVIANYQAKTTEGLSAKVGVYYATLAGIKIKKTISMEVAGILPVVFLFLGFLPQYADFLRYQSVQSVSMLFITADASGSVFSLVSLALREEFDLLAALNYIIVFICDLIVVVFYFYYKVRDRKNSMTANPE
ncbi:hypothetical protein BGX34_010900 [Mortierella sp. NVP85]|nr:hypothetical protein BGX34_010900 [Mortierella sp. NVP85]